MSKLLLIVFVFCSLKSGFANPVNDSIKSYLTTNINYPTLCSENNLSGSVLLALNKPTDSTLKYQILTTTKFVAFEYEILRNIKKPELIKLIPNNKNIFIQINFRILDIDSASLNLEDTILIDYETLNGLNKKDFIVIEKDIGVEQLRVQDSVINLHKTTPELIWQTNSDTFILKETKELLTYSQTKPSKIIVRYSDAGGFFVQTCISSKDNIPKNCYSFSEITVLNDSMARATHYTVIGKDIEINKESYFLRREKVDTILSVLNNLRCFPNQLKHRRRINDGSGYKMDIYYEGKHREYYYYNPDIYSKDKYILETEFMKLFNRFKYYFR